MKTRKTWQQRIGKRMLAHIKETTQTGTLREFKSNLAHQAKTYQPCYDCRMIAAKLNLDANQLKA